MANTTNPVLPVISHMLAVYKLWYACRDSMPKKSRYTLGDKIDNRFIQILELLQIATYQSGPEKVPTLQRALSYVDTVKFLLQIAWEIKAIDSKRYTELSEPLNKVAAEIGGWKKGLQTKTSAR